MKKHIDLSCRKIRAKLAYVSTIPIKCIVVHHGNGTTPYRNDGLLTAKTPDDFLDFIFNSSILGRKITKLKIEQYFHDRKMEWTIFIDVQDKTSETTNITPEVIELLYNSFSSKNGK